MAFIYLPSVVVQPYKIFGATLFAVESTGCDYGTGCVFKIQHSYEFCNHLSAIAAEKLRNNDD